MTSGAIILSLHAAASVMMAGLIWFVQVVHYPLMASVGRATFAGYEVEHTRRTGWVVGPLMLLELATAILLVAGYAPSVSPMMTWMGLAMVVAIWLSTALVQVPCHRRLLAGFDDEAWRRLVASNWLRTILWTARAALAVYLLVPGAGG